MNKITYKTFLSVGFMAAAFALVAIPGVTHADTLYRQLQLGMSGSDVSSLQTFLAQDRTIYPQGLVTGYFGSLTKSAVSNFQARNGIDTAGRVGPATLPVINAQMTSGTNMTSSTGSASATIFNVNIGVNRNAATVNWTTDELAKGVVYYSTSPLALYEYPNSADVSGSSVMSDMNFKSTQSVSVQNLQPNTVYYYLIYTTDQSGNVSVTWPATFQTSN